MYVKNFTLKIDDKKYDSLFWLIKDSFNASLEDILIFDIETTGFSAKNTFCYLIGYLYFKDKECYVSQWFADSCDDEPDIISGFFDFSKNFSHLLTYNGNGFDIPYLTQKALIYSIENTLSDKISLDLYKLISPYKKILKLENLKQKSIEHFLEIYREDKYSGGELISIYFDYIKNPDEKSKQLLLLHNSDDLCGLLHILPVLYYTALFNGLFDINGFSVSPYKDFNGNMEFEFIIDLKFNYSIPKRISFGYEDFYFTGVNYAGKFKIKICSEELKYFYPNYRDYYYLPSEDRAIHKSIAYFVDSKYRTQAKASNCYTKLEGHFLPQYDLLVSPYFKRDYHDKLTFFELNDEFLNNTELMKKYVIYSFNKMIYGH